jgi:ATP synthase protein I
MTPPDEAREPVARSWATRYERGRKAQETRQEFWDDMDSGWIMVAELLTATFLWGGIGWLADRWLGTAPWLMSIGFVVGNATGFYLVYLRSIGRLGKPGAPRTTESRTDEPERIA